MEYSPRKLDKILKMKINSQFQVSKTKYLTVLLETEELLESVQQCSEAEN